MAKAAAAACDDCVFCSWAWASRSWSMTLARVSSSSPSRASTAAIADTICSEEIVPSVGMAGIGDAAHARLLFDSMVISPAGKKRSVYVVRLEHLADALQSLQRHGIELEHVFDF